VDPPGHRTPAGGNQSQDQGDTQKKKASEGAPAVGEGNSDGIELSDTHLLETY
jgi:hypothetical protein